MLWKLDLDDPLSIGKSPKRRKLLRYRVSISEQKVPQWKDRRPRATKTKQKRLSLSFCFPPEKKTIIIIIRVIIIMIIKMAVWSSRLVVERSRSISRRGGFSLFQTFGTFRFLDGRSKCATESYTHTHTHAHTLEGAERIEEETSERCLAKVCHHSTLFFSLNKTKNGH